jgi:hypothetical protein
MRSHEEVPTAIYCGITFHSRQHSVCYCDADDGEIHYREFHHESDDLHGFYSQFIGEEQPAGAGPERRLGEEDVALRPARAGGVFGMPMTSAMSYRRDGWLELLADLSGWVARLDEQLKQAARGDERVLRLQTHPGIGLLTSLVLVHTLEPVSRFGGGRKVAAYVGLEPIEHYSAGKQHFGGIRKGGSRLLRYLLVEAAHTAAKRDERLKKFYQRRIYRRGATKAKVAVARKLLIRGYIILRDRVDYEEFLRRGVEARPARLAT